MLVSAAVAGGASQRRLLGGCVSGPARSSRAPSRAPQHRPASRARGRTLCRATRGSNARPPARTAEGLG